jgi:hypothetical protein
MDTSGTITLYQIIKDYQHITGRGDKDYYRFLNMSVMCLRDLNMFAVDRVKTYKINTADLSNDLGIIPYPSDCIGVYGVFYNNGGKLYPVTNRQDMIYTTTHYLSGSVSTSVQDEDVGEGVDLDSDADDGFATRGGKNDYYYYNDTNERRLIINGVGDVTLWIQYVSSEIDTSKGEQTVLPVFYEEPIHNYLAWKESLFHKRGQINRANLYYTEYKKAKKKIKVFQSPTLEELKDGIYSVWRRTPKR